MVSEVDACMSPQAHTALRVYQAAWWARDARSYTTCRDIRLRQVPGRFACTTARPALSSDTAVMTWSESTPPGSASSTCPTSNHRQRPASDEYTSPFTGRNEHVRDATLLSPTSSVLKDTLCSCGSQSMTKMTAFPQPVLAPSLTSSRESVAWARSRVRAEGRADPSIVFLARASSPPPLTPPDVEPPCRLLAVPSRLAVLGAAPVPGLLPVAVPPGTPQQKKAHTNHDAHISTTVPCAEKSCNAHLPRSVQAREDMVRSGTASCELTFSWATTS